MANGTGIIFRRWREEGAIIRRRTCILRRDKLINIAKEGLKETVKLGDCTNLFMISRR